MMRLWPALSPRLLVREDLFALQAVAQFDFGCWKQSKSPPSQARQAAMQLSIPRRWKGIAPLTVPLADWSQAQQTQSNWSGYLPLRRWQVPFRRLAHLST